MRIDKYIYRTKVDIFVRGFCCTPHHTASLAGILSKRFIVMLIDELPVKDFALKPFAEYGILYYFHSDKRRNALLALIPISHKNVIAEMMQEWDIGNVLLFNLKDDAQWKDCSHNVLKLSPKYLFSEDMSSMAIAINSDEYTCEIRADLLHYSVDEIVEYIKMVSAAV